MKITVGKIHFLIASNMAMILIHGFPLTEKETILGNEN